MFRHGNHEPPQVVAARLTLETEEARQRTEEVKQRTAVVGLAESRVSLMQARVGLATEAVKATRVVVTALVAAVVLAAGIVSCDSGGGDHTRHEPPAVPQQPVVPRNAAYGSRRRVPSPIPSERIISPRLGNWLRCSRRATGPPWGSDARPPPNGKKT
jgi:hypothetical protein